MNHSTATPICPESDASEATALRPSGRRGVRRVLLALLVSVLSLVGAVTMAPPASAYTISSTATVCFQQMGGGAFTGPTQMWGYVDGRWSLLVTQAGTNSGCQTWVTPDNVYLQFQVNYRLGDSTWTSASNVYYNPPRHRSHFGTYIVTWRVRR